MLDVYKTRDVQISKQIMESCLEDGLTLTECISFLSTYLQPPIIEPKVRKFKEDRFPCPKCGNPMSFVYTGAEVATPQMSQAELDNLGVKVLACNKCRYSEIK